MRLWFALLMLVTLSCSSTSTNPTGGSGGASSGGASSGGASSGGASSGGSAGAVNLDGGGDGATSLCPKGTADCDPTAQGCEQSIHCLDCSWVSQDCKNAFDACAANNACACDFACMHECAKQQGPKNDPVLLQTCSEGCKPLTDALEATECALSEELVCCFK